MIKQREAQLLHPRRCRATAQNVSWPGLRSGSCAVPGLALLLLHFGKTTTEGCIGHTAPVDAGRDLWHTESVQGGNAPQRLCCGQFIGNLAKLACDVDTSNRLSGNLNISTGQPILAISRHTHFMTYRCSDLSSWKPGLPHGQAHAHISNSRPLRITSSPCFNHPFGPRPFGAIIQPVNMKQLSLVERILC